MQNFGGLQAQYNQGSSSVLLKFAHPSPSPYVSSILSLASLMHAEAVSVPDKSDHQGMKKDFSSSPSPKSHSDWTCLHHMLAQEPIIVLGNGTH